MLKIGKFLFFVKLAFVRKFLNNIQISVNMIDRLDIIDKYSVKCDFILNTVTFIDTALNISFFFFFFFEKVQTCNVLWFYLFGQEVRNETKGTINLKELNYKILMQKSGLWSLKTGSLIMQVKIKVIALGQVWWWSLNTGGSLIQVVFRSGLTIYVI